MPNLPSTSAIETNPRATLHYRWPLPKRPAQPDNTETGCSPESARAVSAQPATILPSHRFIHPREIAGIPGLEIRQRIILQVINGLDRDDVPRLSGHRACFAREEKLAKMLGIPTALLKHRLRLLVSMGLIAEEHGYNGVTYRRVTPPGPPVARNLPEWMVDKEKAARYLWVVGQRDLSFASRANRSPADLDGLQLLAVYPSLGPAPAKIPRHRNYPAAEYVESLGDAVVAEPTLVYLGTMAAFREMGHQLQHRLVREVKEKADRWQAIGELLGVLQTVERRLAAGERFSFGDFLEVLARHGLQLVATVAHGVTIIQADGRKILDHGIVPAALIRILRQFIDPLGHFQVSSPEFQLLVAAHEWAVCSGLTDNLPVPDSLHDVATVDALLMTPAGDIRRFVQDAFDAFPEREHAGERYLFLMELFHQQLPSAVSNKQPASPVAPSLPVAASSMP